MLEKGFCLATEVADRLGGASAVGLDVRSDADMAKAVEGGFTVDAIVALANAGMSEREIGRLIINPRTLSHRRNKGQRLTENESDRAARVARAITLAERTFANPDKADRWLHKGLNALDGRRPMDLVRTDAGARIVEDLLLRIAWGAVA